jgi:RepB DNA-primase from phage plasmid
MNYRKAQEFLARCFAPGETIALLLRRENPLKIMQRVVKLETAIAPRYIGWLAHENITGANVYVAANPLQPGTRKRTKESIASVRHLYLDIDTDGESRLSSIRDSDSVPAPSAIVQTSHGKYQVLWRVDGFDFEQQETMLKELAIAFGADSACTDCNRVVRVPGFVNCKYDPPHLVTVEYPSDTFSIPEEFRLAGAPTPLLSDSVASKPTFRPGKHGNSENDWAWVSRELWHGKDALKLTRELASRRVDKSDPLYYAQRTVDVASARLWLMEGIGIDDVITMLECRRRFELPFVRSISRAREIAQTAERMIARQKTA